MDDDNKKSLGLREALEGLPLAMNEVIDLKRKMDEAWERIPEKDRVGLPSPKTWAEIFPWIN